MVSSGDETTRPFLLPCQGNTERVAEALHLLNIAAYCAEGHSGVYDRVH